MHYAVPMNTLTVSARLWLSIYIVVVAVMWSIYLIRRNRAIGGALAQLKTESSELAASNKRLAAEIERRKRAKRELKMVQDELSRADRFAALGKISASVAHELSQPIAAMRNYLVAIEIGNNLSKESQMIGNRLKPLVERMEGVSKQLKFFARKGGNYEFRDTDLSTIITNTLRLFEIEIQQRKIEIKRSGENSRVMIMANETRISQVITNLICNAIDAMEYSVKRQIDIKIFVSNRVVLTISDTGCGLKGQMLDDISEPFFTSKSEKGGMGLGLAISRQIIKEHEDEIDVSDNELGGTIMTVSLPNKSKEALL